MVKKKTGRLFLIIIYVIIGCILLGYTTYCLVSCSNDAKLFKVSYINSNPEYGEVYLIGDDQYKEGQEVHLGSISNEGYCVESWTINDEVIGTDPDVTFIMPNNNVEVHVNFAPKKYNVIVDFGSNPHGSVTGVGKHLYKEIVTLAATPDIGYKVQSWYNSVTGESSYSETVIFEMPSHDVRYSIAFAPILYNISVTGDENFLKYFYCYGAYSYTYDSTFNITFTKKTPTIPVVIEGIYDYTNNVIGECVRPGEGNYFGLMPAHDLHFYVKTTPNT